jgi:hypothetical protein
MIISILNIGQTGLFNVQILSNSSLSDWNLDLSLLNIVNHTNIEALGFILYTDYFIFFIIASFILLVAMIGAIVLTIYHEEGVRRQDLFSQVATEYHKTVILT